jgi:branched-chain amino acid transport system permease protein
LGVDGREDVVAAPAQLDRIQRGTTQIAKAGIMQAIVLSGLFVGMIYGLIGVGLVFVYRSSRVVNFAYGETGVIGAFVFADLRFGSSATGPYRDHGLWVALPAGIAISAALGALTELAVVRPLRHAPRIRALVGTFAVGTLFLTYATRQWGVAPHFAAPLVQGSGIHIAGLEVQPEQLLILGVCGALLGGLILTYRYAPFGLRMRALASDPYAAGLVGVNINRTSLAAWTAAGGLSGLSAILIAPLVSFDVTFMTTLSSYGLAAALLGGLSSISWAFAAGVALGLSEAVIAYETSISGITDAVLAGLILLVILLRPSGLARASDSP